MTCNSMNISFNAKARFCLVLVTVFAIGFMLDLTPPGQLHQSHARRILKSEDEDKAAAPSSAVSLVEPSNVTPPSLRRVKPVMATFFEPVAGGCCGMTEEGHQNLVNAWQRAWELYGWETKILTEADARKHPRFDEMTQKLEEVGVDGYNQRCFQRWLAISMEADLNGGWMSDYDFFPLRLTAVIGKELASLNGFKSWSIHVPTLIHADEKSWNLVTDLMIDSISKDLDIDFMSDMYMLEYLYNHHTKQDLGIVTWEIMTYSGFPYKKDGETITIDCPGAMAKLGAHLSHSDSYRAVRDGIFPKIQGVIEGDAHSSIERRAEAASFMLTNFREACLKS